MNEYIMAIIVMILFSISLLLIIGMLYFYLSSFNAGVYPPKRQLHQKAILLGGGGVIFLFLTIILYFST